MFPAHTLRQFAYPNINMGRGTCGHPLELLLKYLMNVQKQAKNHGLTDPSLPRYHNEPKIFEVGSGESYQLSIFSKDLL